MNDKAKTQEEKEKDAASGPAGILSAVLGMGSAIGGMIPNLRKGPQTDFLERQQAGGGAGAAMARQTASEAARRVTGATGGRGGQGTLREGLRAAENITQRGAQQAAITGARESQMATQMLRANEFARRRSFQRLGAGIGQGLAGIGGMLAAAKDQGEVQPEASGAAVAAGQGQGAPTQGMIAQTPNEQMAAGMAADSADTAATMEGFVRTAEGAKSGQRAAYDAEMERRPNEGMPGAYPDAQQDPVTQSVEGVASATAEKQQATQDLMASLDMGGPTGMTTVEALSSPPPSTNPELESWIYLAASNYDPRTGAGLAPQQAAELLTAFGFTPDFVALGIAPMAVSPTTGASNGRN